MKRIVYSLLVIFGVVLLTGCGKEVNFNKTPHVICQKTEVNSQDTTLSTMTFSYDKNEKLEDFKVEEDVIYQQPMSKQALNITAKAMKLIGKAMGLGFKSEVSENRLYFSFSGNIKSLEALMKRLDKEYKANNTVGDTKSEALQELTKEGYTCEDYKN